MGFNIYQQAKEMNADYYDHHTGYTYRIQDYNAGIPADTSVEEGVDS